jgi:hypothetical protein
MQQIIFQIVVLQRNDEFFCKSARKNKKDLLHFAVIVINWSDLRGKLISCKLLKVFFVYAKVQE